MVADLVRNPDCCAKAPVTRSQGHTSTNTEVGDDGEFVVSMLGVQVMFAYVMWQKLN